MNDRRGPQDGDPSPAVTGPLGEAEAAQPSLDALRVIVDGSPNAVLAVGSDGTVVYANGNATTLFGYRQDEFLGRPIEDLLPESLRERHVGHRQGFIDRPQARPMGIGIELSARRRDGTEFPVEISLTPVEVATGRIVFATVVDITARTRIERDLADSERRFRTVLEASPNAMIAIDQSGSIVFANPQVSTTFGIEPNELIGQPVEVLLPARVWDRHERHRTAYMASPTSRPMGIGLDLAGRRADGTEFPVEISLSPVGSGDEMLVFATVVDITARQALQQQLLQAQKMESVGRLAGGIAHDFNNMLSAIRGHADMLLEDLRSSGEVPSTTDVVTSVEAIRDASARAATLTSQLLAFSRQQVLKPRVLEVGEVVRGLEPMLRRLIGERVRLVIAAAPDTGRMRGDPGQIDQIVLNLVVNARDALPGNGEIVIETANATIDDSEAAGHFEVPPGEYVVLSVSDTGVGMDPETREHIFEPFFTTKGIGKGTGLGLATIYGIVRQSGGHIWVYSEPGMGSTFKLFFPRVDAAADNPLRPRAAERGPSTGRILLAEDDPAVREVIQRLLTRAGYTVLAAADGAEAYELLRDTPVDVVVTDVVMPVMTGPELARRVLDQSPTVGVVLVSGYTAESFELTELIRRGAQFVGKPFASSDLLEAVERARAIPNPT